MNLQQGKNIIVFQDNNITILRASNRDINFTIDTEDYERVKNHSWCLSNGYLLGYVNGKLTRLHRFILDLDNNNLLVDHIDLDKTNNRQNNLRLATHKQNNSNCNKRSTNKSGFKGVSWSKNNKKFYTCVYVNSKTVPIGYFNTAQAAAIAYNNKSSETYGEFARMNELDEFDYMIALFD